MPETTSEPGADRSRRAFAVVSGGGTAGHVLPALAVADALVAAGYDRGQVFYFGCERGIETELVPPSGYPYELFDVVGFQRSLTRRNLSFVPKMVAAVRRAVRILRQLKPSVVVSVGGYASMPAVFAARRLGIPIVTVSFDHRPGRASSLTARFSAASAVAFGDSPLPRAVHTGPPVRADILAVDRQHGRAAARARLGVPSDRFLIAVMGGSQGSGVLNAAIWAYLEQHLADTGLAIRHAVGERFLSDAPAESDDPDGAWYRPLGYEPDMASVYAAADLLIGRGGASTVHEVAATGTPAILVPWAAAADDHQTGNVDWLASQGGAVAVAEADIGSLGARIDELRSAPVELARLAADAAAVGQRHRSGALAELIVDVAHGVDTPTEAHSTVSTQPGPTQRGPTPSDPTPPGGE